MNLNIITNNESSWTFLIMNRLYENVLFKDDNSRTIHMCVLLVQAFQF